MLTIIFVLLLAVTQISASCLMYGECGDDIYSGFGPVNCASSNSWSQILEDHHTQLLQQYCPELVDQTGMANTCCDGDQVTTLISKLNFLGNITCLSCRDNFRQYMCQLVCSPNQHQFVKVLQTAPSTKENKLAVLEIEYYVSETFATNFYLTCLDGVSDQGRVLDILCGPWGHINCSPKRLLDYMGGNDLKPYEIRVIISESKNIADSIIPMNASSDDQLCPRLEVGCVWYGQCGLDWDTGLPLNCYDLSPARELDREGVKLLKSICPDLIDSQGNASTCCDNDQINTLIASFELPKAVLSGCPACFRNYNNYFCQLICSPYQSSFLHVQSKRKTTERQSERVNSQITEVEYLVTQTFADGLFDSCQEVHNGLMSGKALDLMCGQWGYDKCTADKWLTYLGSKGNGYTPLLINVTFWSDDQVFQHGTYFTPMNISTTPCSESYGTDGYACQCDECPAAC